MASAIITPTVEAPAFEGIPFSFSWLSLVIPPGLASGANGEEIDRADGEDVAPWGLTPGNIELTLEGYLLQDKFHQPRVYVYPAQAFSDLVPAVGDNIQRIENILGGALAGAADLPHITFFGAAQVLAAHEIFLDFVPARLLLRRQNPAQFTQLE